MPQPDPYIEAARDTLARLTRRGVGMTLAAALYWLGMAAVAAWSGWRPQPLAVFFMLATVVVYPLGWALTRAAGGDLFARGHGYSHLVGVLTGAQFLGWPLLVTVFIERIELVAFALAAMLGAHFLPYGWLYRSPSYYALGIATVLVAAALYWVWPAQANVAVPLGMAACYLLATFGVHRENRAR